MITQNPYSNPNPYYTLFTCVVLKDSSEIEIESVGQVISPLSITILLFSGQQQQQPPSRSPPPQYHPKTDQGSYQQVRSDLETEVEQFCEEDWGQIPQTPQSPQTQSR